MQVNVCIKVVHKI